MENRKDVLKERLNKIFREIFNDSEISISENTTAKDIDAWDSLNHIVLIAAAEKEFGIHLNAAEVGKLENVGELLNILEERATK